MPLHLRDATFNDGKAIAIVNIRAFFDDPFQKTLYPGIPFGQQVEGVFSRWPRNYGEPGAHYKVVVDTDSGEVVSYSKWAFIYTDAGGTLRKEAKGPDFP